MNYITLLVLSFSIGFAAGMPLANAEPLEYQSASVVPMSMSHIHEPIAPQDGYEDFIAPEFVANEVIDLGVPSPEIATNPTVEANFQNAIADVSVGTPDVINYTPVREEE